MSIWLLNHAPLGHLYWAIVNRTPGLVQVAIKLSCPQSNPGQSFTWLLILLLMNVYLLRWENRMYFLNSLLAQVVILQYLDIWYGGLSTFILALGITIVWGRLAGPCFCL